MRAALEDTPSSGDPDLSVVVITRDRARELQRTLRYLTGRVPTGCPIVVVDNGSADRSVSMVRSDFPGVRVLPLGTNRGAAGRNAGIALVKTTFVAFCDDDTWWAPGALERALEVLRLYPQLAVVTARIVVEPDGATDPVSEEMAQSPLRRTRCPGAPLVSFLAGASVVRRRALIGVGGFCDRLLIGGEEELVGSDMMDAGWDMAYIESVRVHHHASRLRDAHLRRRQGIRNTLWSTWLRRPPGSAVRRSRSILSGLPPDRHSARALGEAVAGTPWVLSARRPLRSSTVQDLELLDRELASSKARRYVS